MTKRDCAAAAELFVEEDLWRDLVAFTWNIKGHEESAGSHRPKGVEHGANPGRRTWFEERQREGEQLGYETQPYVVIIGGDRAASRSAPACASCGSPR